MSALPFSLYRALRRLLRLAAAEGVPVSGCVGLPQAATLCPDRCLSALFRAEGSRSSSSVSDAFQALRTLPKQLAVLQASEEETRQALAQWSSLQQHWCRQGPLSAGQALEASESAAWLLQRLVTHQVEQQMLSGADIHALRQQSEDSIAAGQRRLEELAAAARAADAAAFQGGDAPASKEQRVRQLEVLSEVVFRQAKLRNAPFEWVYDGLAPALLPAVLARAKGMPLSLALAAAGVGHRAGIALQLLCAPDQQQSSTQSGPLLMHQLPPEVAARQAGRTTASAPPPDYWLLRLLPPPGQQWADADPVFLDVSQNGKLLDAATAVSRYPQLGTALAAAQQQAPSLLAQQQDVLAVWSSLARTMVTAHQRRGESDMVAHWLYQLLALDTQAVEWGHMLQ